MNSPRTRFYRDKQNAKLMGICAGIADYTGVNSIWVRLGFLGLVIMTGGSILPFYFIAGLLAEKKSRRSSMSIGRNSSSGRACASPRPGPPAR